MGITKLIYLATILACLVCNKSEASFAEFANPIKVKQKPKLVEQASKAPIEKIENAVIWEFPSRTSLNRKLDIQEQNIINRQAINLLTQGLIDHDEVFAEAHRMLKRKSRFMKELSRFMLDGFTELDSAMIFSKEDFNKKQAQSYFKTRLQQAYKNYQGYINSFYSSTSRNLNKEKQLRQHQKQLVLCCGQEALNQLNSLWLRGESHAQAHSI